MVLSRNTEPQNVRTPYKVVMIPAGKALRFTCLTDGYVSLNVHFTGSGAKVCTDDDNCKACLGGSRQIFSGYLLGCCESSGSKRLIHLTGLAAYMLKQEEWRAGSLYGARLILNRIGEKKNGPVESFITGWRDDYERISMDNLEYAVETLYKLHQRHHVLVVDRSPTQDAKFLKHIGDAGHHRRASETDA